MSSERPHVLVVEDEPAQSEVLNYNLAAEGFQVSSADSGDEALLAIEEISPDIVVLDWMIPGVSGIEVCRRLKSSSKTKAIPVIMLSARTEEQDRVRGLETGADDYVTKPYSVAELLARIKTQLRRTRPSAVGEVLTFGDIKLDPETHRVTRNGKPIKLGPIEFRLLGTLMERPGRVFSRDQLLDIVWGPRHFRRHPYCRCPHRSIAQIFGRRSGQ